MEVYDEHVEKYLKLIVDEIDTHGSEIDKVRAGYILEEKLNLSHPIFDSWVKYAQKGGSRKLDAIKEYIPEFSERWCLSLNAF